MHYDLVIIGATVTALGIAKTAKASCKTLILNRTEMVAYEHVYTFKSPGVYSQGAQYYKEFYDLGADILLRTEITEINKDEEGYTLEIFNNAGFQKVHAKILVDTTTERETEISEKSLNSILVNRKKSVFPKIEWNNFLFIDENDEKFNTVIMKYNCDVNLSIYEARHRLIDLWQQRPKELDGWVIAAIGFAFEEKPLNRYIKKDENYYIIPSAYFDTPAASMEAGEELGRRLTA